MCRYVTRAWGEMVEVLSEKVHEGVLRVGLSRRVVVERRLKETLVILPALRRAADREWSTGKATRAFEAVQEERTRLVRELARLPG